MAHIYESVADRWYRLWHILTDGRIHGKNKLFRFPSTEVPNSCWFYKISEFYFTWTSKKKFKSPSTLSKVIPYFKFLKAFIAMKVKNVAVYAVIKNQRNNAKIVWFFGLHPTIFNHCRIEFAVNSTLFFWKKTTLKMLVIFRTDADLNINLIFEAGQKKFSCIKCRTKWLFRFCHGLYVPWNQ